MESKGLGDTIEKMIKTSGVDKIIEKINKKVGKDCGCGKRKNILNKVFPYKK